MSNELKQPTFTVTEIVNEPLGILIITEVRSLPGVKLKPGMKLVVNYPFITSNDFEYEKGMVLELIEKTDASPYGRTSSIGNWFVKCPFQTSVWAKIEYLLGQGNLAVLS